MNSPDYLNVNARGGKRVPGLVRGVAADASVWMAATGRGTATIVADGGLMDRGQTGYKPTTKLAGLTRIVYAAAAVYELPSAVVSGTTGAVITDDGCLLLDRLTQLHQRLSEHSAWQAAGPYRTYQARIGLAMSRGSENFSHVIADLLAQIWQIRAAGAEPDCWLTPPAGNTWLDELLGLVGIPGSRRVSLDDTNVSAERLVVATPSGFAPFTACWVRPAVEALFGDVGRGGNRVIVRRRRATRRRWLDEDDVVRALADIGFEAFDFETLPVADQIKLAASADVLLGAHGAGLVHTLFARRGGCLFEVAPPSIDHPDYWGLAAAAGQRYRRITTDIGASRTHDYDILNDFSVDARHVVQIVHAALED